MANSSEKSMKDSTMEVASQECERTKPSLVCDLLALEERAKCGFFRGVIGGD
jgi:hypothetical protein